MCGRFQQSTPPEELAERFGASAESAAALRAAGWQPRWNVAPGTDVVAVRADEHGARRLSLLRWGLVPYWAKDARIGHRLVNARAESALERPAFRDAVLRRRCLLPADGFYEWTSTGGPRFPWHVHAPDARPFALAALFERWRDPTKPDAPWLRSCTILTVPAAGRLASIHDRMPLVVDQADAARWLDPALRDPGAIAEILAPSARRELVAARVSERVNDPRHDDASIAEPVPQESGS